ncbi:MAG TPA: response regulator transcription factor [Methylocystis sp.]|nr:response regulator transcription factor [Methylocystis sp.]
MTSVRADGAPNSKTRGEARRVLIVDTDQASAALLKSGFVAEGFEIAHTVSGGEAIVLAVSWQPTLVLLDVSLPDIDGLEVIRVLRKHSTVAIIALSARDHETEKIAALDRGANDFVCKPIKLGELLARARAALRTRVNVEPVTLVYQVGHLTIDAATRTVTLRGQTLRFTTKEFEVLHILASANGRVVTQRQLIELVWGAASADSVQYLRVFIGRLRAKIEDDPANPQILVTERGVGYRLVPGGPVHAED